MLRITDMGTVLAPIRCFFGARRFRSPSRIRHVVPPGEIRRVGPGDLLSVLRSLERETAPQPSFRGKTDDATRLTLAMLLFVSRFIPAKRRSRFFNTPFGLAPGGVFLSGPSYIAST
jgi:hypothetical protein